MRVSGSGRLTLTGLSITDVKNFAVRVLPDFTGTLAFSGISQLNAQRGLFDQGSSGFITGSGSFRANSVMDVDVSRNQNGQTCIQSHGSIPWPFYPTPAVPGSGSQVRNSTGTHCMVYILGATVQRVTVDGMDLGVQTSIYLPVDRKIAVKYTGKLSWVWQRVT